MDSGVARREAEYLACRDRRNDGIPKCKPGFRRRRRRLFDLEPALPDKIRIIP
jgi:hypothetical protein